MTFHNLKKVLEANGWLLIRTIGTHSQYRKPGHSDTIIFSEYPERSIPIPLLKDLEKKTGLSF